MKTPRARVAKPVTVKLDPKLAALWKKHIAAVHAHEKRGAEDWDAEWETAGRILDHEPPLYVFGGYETAAEFFTKELGVDERVGRAYVRVASHATPEDEIALTVWRLDAAIGYLEATHGPLAPHVPVSWARVKIEGKALKGCTVAFIKSATRRALTGKKGNEKTAFRDALERTYAKHPAFKRVRFAEAAGKTSIYGVPNASLRTFAEVMLEAKLPAGAGETKKK